MNKINKKYDKSTLILFHNEQWQMIRHDEVISWSMLKFQIGLLGLILSSQLFGVIQTFDLKTKFILAVTVSVITVIFLFVVQRNRYKNQLRKKVALKIQEYLGFKEEFSAKEWFDSNFYVGPKTSFFNLRSFIIILWTIEILLIFFSGNLVTS